jgi:hypothetical protein
VVKYRKYVAFLEHVPMIDVLFTPCRLIGDWVRGSPLRDVTKPKGVASRTF